MEKKAKETPKIASDSSHMLPMKRYRASPFPVIYSNGAQITTTQWDMQIFFEQTVAPLLGEPTNEVASTQQLAIIMSHEHAKAFFKLLKEQFPEEKD